MDAGILLSRCGAKISILKFFFKVDERVIKFYHEKIITIL